MKILLISLTLFLFIIFNSCNPNKKVNYFTSLNDTIVLVTEKTKGLDIFSPCAGDIQFSDTIDPFKYPSIFPDNIKNIRLANEIIDYELFSYEMLQNKDAWNDPEIKNNSIWIMSGIMDGDTIFIVDENNNKNFRDDTLRFYQSVKQEPKKGWWSNTKLIRVKYFLHDGESLIEDSTWVGIAKCYDEGLLIFVSQHYKSSFFIDDQVYEIGLIDKCSGICITDPTLTLLSENGKRKDSLIKSEIVNVSEFIKLKDIYYRFDTISGNGKKITLIKENDFNSQIGTQIGMIAPDFKCLTISRDSISLSNYKGKYLLLANLTACGSKINSYQYYKEMTETYKGTIEFIGIDNSPIPLANSIKELKLSGTFVIAEENKMLQKSFRQDFSSRTCFLIDREGRINAEFEISEWKTNLSKVFGDER